MYVITAVKQPNTGGMGWLEEYVRGLTRKISANIFFILWQAVVE